MKKALIVYGGWEGHHPKEVSEKVKNLLEAEDYSVELSTDLAPFVDLEYLKQYDLVMTNWTVGDMTWDQAMTLQKAVESGVGFGGWHGGAGDAFRKQVEFQILVGGQFVAHPGNNKDYTIDIADPEHPATAGLGSFTVKNTEQYYMHIDPSVHVIASSVVNQPTLAWLEGTVMPVAWVRPWGEGRVFYFSLGHQPDDFDLPEARKLLIQGLRWATR